MGNTPSKVLKKCNFYGCISEHLANLAPCHKAIWSLSWSPSWRTNWAIRALQPQSGALSSPSQVTWYLTDALKRWRRKRISEQCRAELVTVCWQKEREEGLQKKSLNDDIFHIFLVWSHLPCLYIENSFQNMLIVTLSCCFSYFCPWLSARDAKRESARPALQLSPVTFFFPSFFSLTLCEVWMTGFNLVTRMCARHTYRHRNSECCWSWHLNWQHSQRMFSLWAVEVSRA